MIIRASEDGRLKDILEKAGLWQAMPCGGLGQCGRCRVRAVNGDLPLTEADREMLGASETAAGYRLACQAKVTRGMLLELPEEASDFYIPGTVSSGHEKGPEGGAFSIAVDLGTTTLCLARVMDGVVTGDYRVLNRQRSYGADVMSRIHAAMSGHGEALRRLVCEDILAGIKALGGDAGELPERIVIAGNTTMMRLLAGEDVAGLAAWPFDPGDLSLKQLKAGELLLGAEGPLAQVPVTLFPGIGPFLGADLTAALYGSCFDCDEAPGILLDLGTNAEMAIGKKGRILAASASAGPAFEGGRIRCGTGSIPGAVCDVRYEYGLMRYETIGHMRPAGICGSGLIACMDAMRRAGYMDKAGLLKASLGGSLKLAPALEISQADIREFQKAKAAVRAGLDCLIGAFNEPLQNPRLILCGGFGLGTAAAKAERIGLIPSGLKCRQMANGVISGLTRYLKYPDDAAVTRLAGSVSALELAGQPDFAQAYLEAMNFG